jgi:putative transposase
LFLENEKIYADRGYRGELAENVKKKFGWDMKIILHSDKSTKFKPLPKTMDC